MKAFFHPEQLLHDPQSYLSRGQMRQPQEVPERARRILQAVKALGYPVIEPPDRGMEPLRAVHTDGYLRFLETGHGRWKAQGPDWGAEIISNVHVREPNALRGILAEAGAYLADGSCPVGENTWRSAYWSAQSAIAAAHEVLAGAPAAFALCRPPGHHARAAAAGGFCYLNNTAIAAQLLRAGHQRVAILDTDMHHGQGVQEIFWQRPDVLYVSIHADPTNFYPATAGFDDERGGAAGAGFNVNLPMPHGSDEAAFFARVDEAARAVRDFAPTALVHALGFDIFKDDPQARVSVSSEGFRELGRRVHGLGLPTVIVQEGGYAIESLERNATNFFEGFAQR
jgi:acetoin utilization deacetylase AcuC-like enzyme